MMKICAYFVPRGTKIFRGGTIFFEGGTKWGGTKFSGGDLFFEAWGGTIKKTYAWEPHGEVEELSLVG